MLSLTGYIVLFIVSALFTFMNKDDDDKLEDIIKNFLVYFVFLWLARWILINIL